jgi:TrmH family RNA methyltransferase
MRRPLPLTSPDNPRIKHVLHLRKNRDRREGSVFIAEGRREIGRALDAGLPLRQFFYTPSLAGSWDQLLEEFPQLRLADPPDGAFELTPPLLQKIAYLERPEGLLALFEQPRWDLRDLPRSATDLFLIATGIEKPGNLGAMARTAAAAGCTALLMVDETVDPFNPNAIRASTGAVFTLPIVSASVDEVMRFCQERQVQIVAATPEARVDHSAVDLTPPTAIVIGAEHEGLDPRWKQAGQGVRIPMAPGVVDSLNASTAAAILLFEAVRQRRHSAG